MRINNTAVPSPKTFQVALSDLDGKSDRDAQSGDMYRDRIAVKRKLTCEWGPLSPQEMSKLLQAVQDVFFYVEYLDPVSGVLETRTFYVGDRSAPMLWKDRYGRPYWGGLTMNFVEK